MSEGKVSEYWESLKGLLGGVRDKTVMIYQSDDSLEAVRELLGRERAHLKFSRPSLENEEFGRGLKAFLQKDSEDSLGEKIKILGTEAKESFRKYIRGSGSWKKLADSFRYVSVQLCEPDFPSRAGSTCVIFDDNDRKIKYKIVFSARKPHLRKTKGLFCNLFEKVFDILSWDSVRRFKRDLFYEDEETLTNCKLLSQYYKTLVAMLESQRRQVKTEQKAKEDLGKRIKILELERSILRKSERRLEEGKNELERKINESMRGGAGLAEGEIFSLLCPYKDGGRRLNMFEQSLEKFFDWCSIDKKLYYQIHFGDFIATFFMEKDNLNNYGVRSLYLNDAPLKGTINPNITSSQILRFIQNRLCLSFGKFEGDIVFKGLKKFEKPDWKNAKWGISFSRPIPAIGFVIDLGRCFDTLGEYMVK